MLILSLAPNHAALGDLQLGRSRWLQECQEVSTLDQDFAQTRYAERLELARSNVGADRGSRELQVARRLIHRE